MRAPSCLEVATYLFNFVRNLIFSPVPSLMHCIATVDTESDHTAAEGRLTPNCIRRKPQGAMCVSPMNIGCRQCTVQSKLDRTYPFSGAGIKGTPGSFGFGGVYAKTINDPIGLSKA